MAAISINSITFNGNNEEDEEEEILEKNQTKNECDTSNRSRKGRELNLTRIAITRRNARERNRVKQVNNGFLTLRQHIPTEIAATFENGRNIRNNNKKLSKVETLRMAVEYIRTLKEILQKSTEENQTKSFDISSKIYNSNDVKIQYVLFPGTGTYQLHSTNTFVEENTENIRPRTVDRCSTNTENILKDDILYSNIGSPSINNKTNNVCSPGADGLTKSYSKEQFQTLPPIEEVLQQRSVIRNNLVYLSKYDSISSPNQFNQTPSGTGTCSVSDSSIYSCDSSDDYIKLEPLPDNLDSSFGHCIVKKEQEMIDVMDWWENHSKFTLIES